MNSWIFYSWGDFVKICEFTLAIIFVIFPQKKGKFRLKTKIFKLLVI